MSRAYMRDTFATDHPIVNAPMAGAAGGRLAAAVSAAGGLGMVGMGSAATADWIDNELSIAAGCGKPWGIGVMAWALADGLEPLHRALRYHPSVVSISFGNPAPALDVVRKAGSVSAMQIGNSLELDQALEHDVDIIVVRGAEGGGHGRNDVGTLPLLQLALQATAKPVLAAGGIATASGVAAALAAGAAGAWIGTRFATTQESLMKPAAKEAIEHAGTDDTVYTRAFDIAAQLDWPPHYGGRAISNAFTDEWAERPEELERIVRSGPEQSAQMRQARQGGNVDMAPVYAGQSAGLTGGGQSVADVVAGLAEYRQLLAEAASIWSR